MITQLLGVALISLLNITPTIQQNNIEQLIAPNIDILTNGFINPSPLRIYEVENYSYYWDTGSGITEEITSSRFYINYANVLDGTAIRTFETTGTSELITINNNNFYIYDQQSSTNSNPANVTRSTMMDLIEKYYELTYDNDITNTQFSWTTSNTIALAATVDFYTYSVTGRTGTITGRVYVRNLTTFGQTNLGVTNNTVTINNPSVQSLIQAVNPLVNELEFASTADHKIWYYYTSDNLANTNGTYTTILRARTNYGRVLNLGTITYTLAIDNTPPTITSVTGNSVNWTNQNVTLTVQANDNGSLNTEAYSFDNGSTYQTSNTKLFTTNEIVNIKVRDSSNNVSTTEQVIINRIDKQTPAIVLAGNWKNTFELYELTSNNDLLNYLTISDGASGVNSSLTTISNFNYNQAGTYTNVQISATDNAGNTFVNTLPTITITESTDTTPPTISGSTVQTRVYGTVTTQDLLDTFTISDPSGIVETRIQKLDNTIVTSWNDYNVGSHQLRVYARDTIGNIALYQFELVITAPPAPDTTPPVITGPLLVSSPMGTYTSTSEILALYTITDNVAVTIQQLQGTIDFQTQGEYQVTIFASDAANNTTTRNIVVRIRSEMSLDGYNPITDLLSGIFGGVLSLIFTIGTINLLGFRLLDAMAIIILGGVIYLVYKAIRK
jgi:hypothetical protein